HVTGKSVPQILLENNYQPIEQPEPSDLVVYRDSVGEVLHTGMVRAVGQAGFVLIESKWSLWGTYLHQPSAQCYSSAFTYYRSPRNGHLLTGLSADASAGSRAILRQ